MKARAILRAGTCVAAGLVVLLLWNIAVSAEESKADLAKGRELDKQAMQMFKQGRKIEAIKVWQEAAGLMPPEKKAQIVMNIAVAYESLEELEQAWAHYQRAATLIGEGGNVAARKARALGKRLSQTHGRLIFSVQPADAMVEIHPEGGDAIQFACPPVWWLETGRYTVLLGQRGYRSDREDLQVVAGKDYVMKATLEKVDESPPAQINTVVNGEVHAIPVVSDPRFGREETSSFKEKVQWAAVGLGAGLIGGGAAFHLGAAMREDGASPPPAWWWDGALVLYGVGAGMAATGITMFILDREDDAPVRIEPLATPGGMGASFSMGF